MRTRPFLSLACRFVTGEEEKSSFECSRQQSESLNKMMILTQTITFTLVVVMPVFHRR